MLLEYRIKRQARKDAAARHEANLDHLTVAHLGPKPRGPSELEDQVLLEQEGDDGRLENLNDEIEALDRQLAEKRPRLFYMVICMLAFGGEALAAFFVLGMLGFEPRERFIVGISLAAGTALLAGVVSWAERSARTRWGRWFLRSVTGMAYFTVSLSLAWLRATGGEHDELLLADLAASTVALLVATASPGLVMHWTAVGFVETSSFISRKRRATRERRQIERRRSRSRDKRIASEKVSGTWEADAALVRSVYLTEHRRALAEITAREDRREGDNRQARRGR